MAQHDGPVTAAVGGRSSRTARSGAAGAPSGRSRPPARRRAAGRGRSLVVRGHPHRHRAEGIGAADRAPQLGQDAVRAETGRDDPGVEHVRNGAQMHHGRVIAPPRRGRGHRHQGSGWQQRPGCAGSGASVRLRYGPAHLRLGERIRRDLHPAGSAPPEPGRGGPLPVPAGGQLGPVLQRVPRERRPPVSRRRQPSRIRHARVRLHRRPGRPRQGGGADPRAPGQLGRGPACERRASAGWCSFSKTTPTRPATPTDATRTT